MLSKCGSLLDHPIKQTQQYLQSSCQAVRLCNIIGSNPMRTPFCKTRPAGWNTSACQCPHQMQVHPEPCVHPNFLCVLIGCVDIRYGDIYLMVVEFCKQKWTLERWDGRFASYMSAHGSIYTAPGNKGLGSLIQPE